jgi:hypothetical protein
MGLLFLGDEREDFVAMIEEVTKRVEDLGLGDAQSLGDIENRFAALMQRDHVTDTHAQSVDHRLAAADAFEPDYVGVLGLHGFGHADSSDKKSFDPSPV